MIVKFYAKFVNERSIALLKLRSCYCTLFRLNEYPIAVNEQQKE